MLSAAQKKTDQLKNTVHASERARTHHSLTSTKLLAHITHTHKDMVQSHEKRWDVLNTTCKKNEHGTTLHVHAYAAKKT